jgi:hypothetical protein
VLAELARREGLSGLEEKASRQESSKWKWVTTAYFVKL